MAQHITDNQERFETLQKLICEELKLDPTQVTEMQITTDDIHNVTISWDGYDIIDMEKFNELLRQAGM